jgi:prephenate dehydratase
MTAVTLGPAGTYSHRAAQVVADEIEFRESVTRIVELVATGTYERGVIPIENSIEGSVTESLDALIAHDVAVVRELVTPIRHGLLAQTPTFTTIASHPQALAQCRTYLEQEYPDADLEATASTMRAVEQAQADSNVAAIAHPDASGEDLQLVAEGIQDQDSNATRFVAIGPPADQSPAGAKTSLIVYPKEDYPGLLLELLEPFADNDINLSRVESRPSGERLGDYVFHLDVEAGLYEDRLQTALDTLDNRIIEGWIRQLGSYDRRHVLSESNADAAPPNRNTR